jgi:hypothetical protein
VIITIGTYKYSVTENGLVLNADGVAVGDLQAQSDTEANMLFLDASADTVYLGGTTNGVSIAKGESPILIGTATVWDDFRTDILNDAMGGASATSIKEFKDNGATPAEFGLNFNANGKYGTLAAYTNFTNDLQSAAWSIECWVKPNSTSSAPHTLFGQSGKVEFGTYQNKAYFRTTGTYFLSGVSFNVNAWNHFVWTYATGTGVTMYVNGSPTTATGMSALTSITGNWLLGAYTSTTQTLSAIVDIFRMYNAQLSAAQCVERYNLGVPTTNLPTGITEATQVTFTFLMNEGTGTAVANSATRGTNSITLTGSPSWVAGATVPAGSFGVYAPVYEYNIGQAESIRWEMPHDWKTGSAIGMHMHISSNIPIPQGAVIKFQFEHTIQDIWGVFSSGGVVTVVNQAMQFPVTTLATYTFTVPSGLVGSAIPAYSNIIITFNNIDMSAFNSVSVCGIGTTKRLLAADGDTFNGDIFIIQPMRGHYEKDSAGSKTMYSK